MFITEKINSEKDRAIEKFLNSIYNRPAIVDDFLESKL